MHESRLAFQHYLRQQNMRITPQRMQIVDVFLNSTEHLSTEELYEQVKKIDSCVGQATVYRTLKLLCSAQLAREMQFGDGTARYEQRHDEHHDHLICERCGKTLEVLDKEIERLQADLVRAHGFIPTSHRMYLFGVCPDCAQNPPVGPAFSAVPVASFPRAGQSASDSPQGQD